MCQETDWELGNRRVPQYLLRLMAYKVQMEKLAEKKRQIKITLQLTNNISEIAQQVVA